MILGYGIIAVPTGIVTAELTRAQHAPRPGATRPATRTCPRCADASHEPDSRFCRKCGAELDVAGG